MIRPSSLAVRALKFLQKSMMLTPAWPRAGPTGGAGVALPAGICSLIEPVIFFISSSQDSAKGYGPRNGARGAARLELFHLQEVELDRGGPPEDRDHHLQGVAVEVDLFHHAL